MTISPREMAKISTLSRTSVEQTLVGLRKHMKGRLWVSKANRYVQDPVKTIEAEQKGAGLSAPKELAQYVAASGLLHCSDGWSYLGKSIISLLRGDPYRSLHLAYYAELRAAMSMLASEGIGVFSKQHVIIDKPDSVVVLKGESGTHEFVWSCLQTWADNNGSSDLLGRIVRPYARSLDDWFTPLGGISPIAPIAKKWLRDWRMDLNVLPKDRNARNEASYRPGDISLRKSIKGHITLEFVRNLWSSLEPGTGSGFQLVDQNLLRIAFETHFFATTQKAPSDDRAGYASYIDKVVNNQNLPAAVAKKWRSYLTRRTARKDLAILDLSQVMPDDVKAGYFGVISRAVLLLRMASGSNAELTKAAGITIDDVSFWWRDVGLCRGLWDQDPIDPKDLWSDIKEILDEVVSFQERTYKRKQSFHRIGSELGASLIGLASCERVAIWNVAA